MSVSIKRVRGNLVRIVAVAFCSVWLTTPASAIVDFNDNGLSDIWEKQFNDGALLSPGFDPNADADGDGWTNSQEATAGTSPFNSNAPIGLVKVEIAHAPATYTTLPNGTTELETPEAMVIIWPTISGKTYQLWGSFNLEPGSWFPVDYERYGDGAPIGTGVPLTQPDGSLPDSVFWRVEIKDTDSDGDNLVDAEEQRLGSGVNLADTDGDGIDDYVALTDGNHPSGNGIDLDEDGVPDSQLYNAVFEITHERREAIIAEGFGETTDQKSRYFTKTYTEEFSVSGSPLIASTANQLHTFEETYLEDDVLISGAEKQGEPVGQTFDEYAVAHPIPYGPGETLVWSEEPEVTVVTGPTTTMTATEKETTSTTTRTRSWKVFKDGAELRGGTQTITIETTTKWSDPLTIEEIWNDVVKPLPWEEEAPYLRGPLYQVGQVIGGAGYNTGAEIVRSWYSVGDYGIHATLSSPRIVSNAWSDRRIKSIRWRWARFEPNDPFNYHFAGPASNFRRDFSMQVNQRNQFDAEEEDSDETLRKGVIGIECKGSDGAAGWKDVPPAKYSGFMIEAPAALADMTFAGDECHSEVTATGLPMLPMTGSGNRAHSATDHLKESNGPPTVHLETIESADISVAGGQASVTISGEVYDAIMGSVPTGGGADIPTVTAYLNGAETDIQGTLTRSLWYRSDYAPYGPRAEIQPFAVTMPASGVNRVAIVTAPNAAGLKGRAEFEIVFEQTFGTAVVNQAVTVARDLILPAQLTTTTKETIHLSQPGQAPADDLVETEDNSRYFVSAQTGASVVLAPQFQPSSAVDSLPCAIFIPGEDTRGAGTSGSVVCIETGANTRRFSYSKTISASSGSAAYTWTNPTVYMDEQGFVGMAHPIVFPLLEYGAVTDVTLKWLGRDFPITPGGLYSRKYASTAPGKPLVGFLVHKDNENAPPSREFIYYDHSSSSLRREAIGAADVDTSYRIDVGGHTTEEINVPIAGWRLLNQQLEESPLDGFLPMSIESLIDLVEGDTSVIIPDDSKAIIEVSGRLAGDVLRVFSPDETEDRFDLTIPGQAPRITLAPRNDALTAAGDQRFRSDKLMIMYSTGGDSPDRLTDAQWQALRAMGYLAIHNAAPVIASTKDLAWAMEKFGPVNLPLPNPDDPDAPKPPPMGINGVTDTRNAQFYRFKGYQDHHVFNQYSDNKAKRDRWIKIFGDDFNVDEFTVPVKEEYHGKVSRRITEEWEAFLGDSFDENHKLKPGIDAQQLRRDTMDKMREINGRWGIDTSRLREYPEILNPRRLQTRASINLCNRLVSNKGRLGCSLDKLKVIDEMAFGPILKGTNAARNAWWKDTAKKVFKREGKKGVGKLVPILSSAITVASIASASANVTQVGWEEAVAQEINNQLALDDIELAREAVRQQFNTGVIGGGTPRPVLPLANGQIIGMNERTFTCSWSNSGVINDVVPYVITEIKVFPDGTTKVAAKMECPPFEVLIEENPDHIIRDYWPQIGDSGQLYMSARARAITNSNATP